MLLNNKILLISLLVFTGCVHTKPTYAPDGSKAYSISCSGGINDWNDCLTEAGELCQAKGYEVLDRVYEESQSGHAWQTNAHLITDKERTLLIKCKK